MIEFYHLKKLPVFRMNVVHTVKKQNVILNQIYVNLQTMSYVIIIIILNVVNMINVNGMITKIYVFPKNVLK